MKDHFEGPAKKLTKVNETNQSIAPIKGEIVENNLYLHT
jgi:hypothetical protein